MEVLLLNPNFAYVMLVTGFLLVILALLSPGTGILEIAALFVLLAAGWGVFHLTINFWALLVLLIGVIPFLLAVRKTRRLIFLGITIFTLMIGSIFLFRGDNWLPVVDPILALVVSALSSGFLWIMVTKTLEASLALSRLIGTHGEAKTAIHEEGSVQVDGELWSAQSETHIPMGARVRVIGRDGFILCVIEV
jgi:membrane-bound serine protease (ClpP class)